MTGRKIMGRKSEVFQSAGILPWEGQVEQVVLGAPINIHVDLSIQEVIKFGPDAVEEGR